MPSWRTLQCHGGQSLHLHLGIWGILSVHLRIIEITANVDKDTEFCLVPNCRVTTYNFFCTQDASCNYLEALSPTLTQLANLAHLNLHRNLLKELPNGNCCIPHQFKQL